MDRLNHTLLAAGELLERLNGPLSFRLIIMPMVVSFLAIRAGLKDARERQPTFLYGMVTHPAERPRLLRSALADIGKVFVVAILLDTAYQLATGESFRLMEVLVVAVSCAIVPYVALRGPVALLMRDRGMNKSKPVSSKRDSKERKTLNPDADH